MLVLCLATGASAQDAAQEAAPDDTRTQFPAFMRDSYFSLRVGYIGYLFTGTQLEPGFQAESIERPRPAVRLVFGHHFRNLAARSPTCGRRSSSIQRHQRRQRQPPVSNVMPA
jgi:hypothetical protein